MPTDGLAATLLGEKKQLNEQLDKLFQTSAGKSKAALLPAPIDIKPAKDVPKKRLSVKKQKELLAKKAALAAKLSQEAASTAQKRKSDALEKDDDSDEESDKENDEESGEESVEESDEEDNQENDTEDEDAEQSDSGADEDSKIKSRESQRATRKEEREKATRTVFVGNVPIECLNKATGKALKRKFAEFGPVESIRFRSVAFSEGMPRKAAFIKKKLHNERHIVNAYIVYKEASSVEKALTMNGQVFMDKHLRVDSVSKPKSHDRKRSVFVGSLPFNVEEEELWAFFKDCGEIENVRIVRDKQTNIGKGIGYVQFTSREAVELGLALDDTSLRENNKIRVQRCKASISEGGVRTPVVKKNGKASQQRGKRPQKGPGKLFKSGKPSAKLFEGERAFKGKKEKLKVPKSKKNPGMKHKHKKQKRA